MAEQRIQKVLADQGICSRREADRRDEPEPGGGGEPLHRETRAEDRAAREDDEVSAIAAQAQWLRFCEIFGIEPVLRRK